ncbi:hypothetical protein SVIOM342S_08804 [Streptomyces violaceorubidus]
MVQHLDGVLAAEDPALPVGRLLARRPELRGAVERLQSLAGHAYAVPHANIRDAAFVPARIIRLANAALYGLERTKDYLGRDLRGVIFQGAPTAADLVRRCRGPCGSGRPYRAPPTPSPSKPPYPPPRTEPPDDLRHAHQRPRERRHRRPPGPHPAERLRRRDPPGRHCANCG